MICLFMNEAPATFEELHDAIVGALGRLTSDSIDNKRVTLQPAPGAEGLSLLRVDLNALRLSSVPPNLKPPVGKETSRDFHVDSLEITGDPVVVSGASVMLSSSSSNVRLGYATDDNGLVWLGPSKQQDAPSGQLQVSALAREIEHAAEQVLQQFAREKGVALSEFKFETAQVNESTIGIYAAAVGKKFGFGARIFVRGVAQLNNDLDLVLRDLEARGEGAAGSMAATALSAALRKYEGHTISLSSFAVGGAKLQELQLQAGDTLGLRARFGVA